MADEVYPRVEGAIAGAMADPVRGVQCHLDWEAYWVEFQNVHGGDPVPFEGRLLFRDGWTYSSSDHAGPEWPPDERRLDFVKRAYWLKRREMVAFELSELRERVLVLKNLQHSRSAPIQSRIEYVGADNRMVVERVAGLVDFSGRVRWLEADLRDCEEALKVNR